MFSAAVGFCGDASGLGFLSFSSFLSFESVFLPFVGAARDFFEGGDLIDFMETSERLASSSWAASLASRSRSAFSTLATRASTSSCGRS